MTHPRPERNELVVEHGVFRGLLLFAAVIVALWAFWLIFAPFVIPIAWALCLGAVTTLPYRWLVQKWRKPRLAAVTMTFAVFLVVLGPLVLLCLMLVQEASQIDFQPLIDEVRVTFPDAYGKLTRWLGEVGMIEKGGQDPLAALNDTIRENLPQLVGAAGEQIEIDLLILRIERGPANGAPGGEIGRDGAPLG